MVYLKKNDFGNFKRCSGKKVRVTWTQTLIIEVNWKKDNV